jgi:LytS/YehU family sensor histidine kinase
VSFRTDEISEKIKVAPMLLIPFVENAFKHGSLVDGFLSIEIDVSLVENQLSFKINNTFLTSDEKQLKNGIGLENIKNRLNLLYQNNHQLQMEQQDNWFKVHLKITNLNS